MYLISIMDVYNILGLNKVADLDDDFGAMRKVEKLIHELSVKSKIYVSRIKTDKFNNIIMMFYHMHHGIIEVTLSDITTIEFFFVDAKIADKFHAQLVKYFKEYLDDQNQYKDVFIESLIVFEKTHQISTSLNEDSKIVAIFERSVNLLLISFGIFTLIEVTKAVLAEVFAEYFAMHQFLSIVITAVLVAFLFKPLEEFTHHFVAKWIFRKKR